MGQPFTIIPSNGSDPADEWIRLGVQAHVEGKLDKAEESYRQALRVDPRNIIATQNLAVALASRGNLNEALLTAERAAMQDGDTSLIHSNRALICLEADRIDEGLASVETAIRIAENNPRVEFPDPVVQAMFVKALISGTAGKPQDSLAAYEEMLQREPAHQAAGPNSCFVQSLLDFTPDVLLAHRKRYAATMRANIPPPAPHRNDRSPDRVLRIGYVGGDFKTHSAAMIFGSVLLSHDAKQVEPYIYSSLPVNAEADEMTKRFFNATEGVKRWRDIVPLNDDQACELIRKDGIDILVDLAAHTSGGRLGIFLRKPAPVQITAWGFAHGTGMDEIDYFLADSVAVPESERQHYAEKILDLPCVVSYLPPTYNLKGTSTAPAAYRGYFTFGCYARYEKLSDECLKTFAEILRRVPDSRLQFKDHAFRRPYSIRRVMSFMTSSERCLTCGGRGEHNNSSNFGKRCDTCEGSGKGLPIDPERLSFSISTSHSDHLLAYQQCDLCLDPWPHGGGVVFLEQMWMGVPTLTLRGRQPSGRTASSVLTAMDLGGYIADTPEMFVEKAVVMASGSLALSRKELRDRFLKSPVVAGYPQAVERVYREAWYNYCKR